MYNIYYNVNKIIVRVSKVIDILADKISLFIKDNTKFKSEDDVAKMKYSLQIIFGESFKLTVLLILFLIIGNLKYLLFSMGILFTTRPLIGGYHFKTVMGCLISSIIFFLITCIIGPIIPKLNILAYYIISIIIILIVFLKSPFPNRVRPIKNKKRKQTFKKKAIFFSTLWIIILLTIKDKNYLNCGFLNLSMQVCQIFFIKEM